MAFESYASLGAIRVEPFTRFKISLLSKWGLEYVEPKRGFETVGGYDLLKDYVKRRIIDLVKNPEEASRYGLSIPRGVILFGLRGPGSWFARAMAAEVGLPMIHRRS